MSRTRLRVRERVFLGFFLLTGQLVWAGDDPGIPEPGEATFALIGQPQGDYQARRRTLMRQILEQEAKRSEGEVVHQPVVVLVGQDEDPISALSGGKFRQKNDFAYLTGVEAPSACLILLPKEDRETLYLPPLSRPGHAIEEVPDGPGREAAEKLGFSKVESTSRFLADLFGAIADPRKEVRERTRIPVVYMISRNSRLAANSAEIQFARFLREGAPTTEIRDVTPLLAAMRKVKSGAEIALLQKAIDVTGSAQDEVIKMIRPGLYEYELEAKIAATFIGRGAQRAGFPPIVGSGPNSTIPHYFANRRKIEEGELVVVDIGAEYSNYTADITRTYPADGKFSPRQREIYQLVLDAQTVVAVRVKAGATKLREMTGWTREFLKQSPLRARDREGQEHTMDRFFLHGLSHYLGMDVHDVGDTGKPIEPGEVFTIEPGIYIPSENLGVRIEDDYLMTDHGLEKLSKSIPSDPDDIERLIERARKASRAPAPAAPDDK
jgi:Xaa-Pro aminopeptidase